MKDFCIYEGNSLALLACCGVGRESLLPSNSVPINMFEGGKDSLSPFMNYWSPSSGLLLKISGRS